MARTKKLKTHMFNGNGWTDGVVTTARKHGIPARPIYTDQQREELLAEWERRLSSPISDREALAELAVFVEELHNKLDQLGHFLGCNWRTDEKPWEGS